MRVSLFKVFLLILPMVASHAAEPLLISDPRPLPLAIDKTFEFRKIQQLFVSPEPFSDDTDPTVAFERQRVLFGAVTEVEKEQRYGTYFRFFWKTARPANVRVRLEYRMQKLGAYVQALEYAYDDVKGSVKTEFEIIGDDFSEDGRVVSWRAMIIENGRVVALTQSALWR